MFQVENFRVTVSNRVRKGPVKKPPVRRAVWIPQADEDSVNPEHSKTSSCRRTTCQHVRIILNTLVRVPLPTSGVQIEAATQERKIMPTVFNHSKILDNFEASRTEYES